MRPLINCNTDYDNCNSILFILLLEKCVPGRTRQEKSSYCLRSLYFQLEMWIAIARQVGVDVLLELRQQLHLLIRKLKVTVYRKTGYDLIEIG